jgi:hypothetical protein
MFVEHPNTNELRQGDVVEALSFPLIECAELVHLGLPEADAHRALEQFRLRPPLEGKQNSITLQLPATRAWGVVLSPCCDLELRNGKMIPPFILIAPLVAKHVTSVGWEDPGEQSGYAESNPYSPDGGRYGKYRPPAVGTGCRPAQRHSYPDPPSFLHAGSD